jgi:Fe-S oxidoreductase
MSGGRKISYQPTAGLSYDPIETLYWDSEALQGEVDRVFEVCSGCRMCFKYCDSFPLLFKEIDEACDGDVSLVSPEVTEQVMDSCFQCKLCEVQCPYTPRDDHEFKLDFPRLVHRWKAQRARTRKGSLGERVLANPDRLGALARASGGMANVLNRSRLHRLFMEKVLGVHREKLLPDFARSTFEKWARRDGLCNNTDAPEAVLFQTCFVQHNSPELGRDAIEVLQRNGVKVVCAEGFRCCGMPAWESGDLDTLRANARVNLDLLDPFVELGARVLAINPTCSMMMRREWPELLEGEDRERAQRLAPLVADVSEYLWSLRDEARFNTDFLSSPGDKVAYHAPCHLRAQAVGFPGRDLLRGIPGVKPAMTMECCGHDGTWSMTVRGFEASARVGKKAFDGMQSADSEVWATDCPLAAIQFEQHAGRRAMHPLTVLARAYRQDGFKKRLREPGDESQ